MGMPTRSVKATPPNRKPRTPSHVDQLRASPRSQIVAVGHPQSGDVMLWILTSLFFLWCAFHEIHTSLVAPPGFGRPTPISNPCLAVVLSLAVIFAWPPVRTWMFERFLSGKATELADGHRAHVHCNTVWDTMLDPAMLAGGHANPETGKIGLQHPWCSTLKSYLAHPSS